MGEETLQTSRVVVAMGPWTSVASQWLPGIPPIMGQLGHSVVLQAQQPLSSHCFFVNHSGPGMDGICPLLETLGCDSLQWLWRVKSTLSCRFRESGMNVQPRACACIWGLKTT